MEELVGRVLAIALLSLRVAPTLAFAPPFTLLRIPSSIRVIFGVALTGAIAAAQPQATWDSDFLARGLPAVATGELFMGVGMSLSLQIAFAAMLWAGRVIDVQAGFGLALLVDPTTRAQLPLVGTIFAYLAGAIFFALDGGHDLLAVWAASVEAVPLGQAVVGSDPGALTRLLAYVGQVFVIALGFAGFVLLVLFLLDLTIAFMSRTLPQMNMLLLGFQVKTIALLLALPVGLSLTGVLFVRILRLALENTAFLVG